MFDTVGTMEINLGSTSSMMWGMIFGAIGVGYFIFGKKQARLIPLLSGIGLCAFPYFISNTYIVVLLGIILIALPFLIAF
jgi:hypothetical protein